MKTILAGSRTISDIKHIKEAIKLSNIKITSIVSGGARGADSLGEMYAKSNKIPYIVINAKWNEYGRSAGYIRNEEMAKVSEACIIVWDGVSVGSMHMARIAKKYGLKLFVHDISDNSGIIKIGE